jgi:hypothetical protein
MNVQMFLLVGLLICALALLCAHCWPQPGLVRSRAAAKVRTTLPRLLKPRTPDDCHACRLASTPAPSAGEHAQTLHKRTFCHLHLPHLQLDELRTRLRCTTQILWLWLAIDPRTKILPVLELGPRTQHMAHRVIHSLRERLAPGCIPLFTSDGLNLYFSALTAHFGPWLPVRRRGRNVRQWQVAAGLIYGQVKKSYRRRKLVQVTSVMRLGTEETLTAALQALGFSGRLNTAFIERVNLTVRNARGGSGKTDLGHFSTSAPAAGPSGMVARVLPFCTSPCFPVHDARAAARTRGEAASATLSSADPSHAMAAGKTNRRWTAREVLLCPLPPLSA